MTVIREPDLEIGAAEVRETAGMNTYEYSSIPSDRGGSTSKSALPRSGRWPVAWAQVRRFQMSRMVLGLTCRRRRRRSRRRRRRRRRRQTIFDPCLAPRLQSLLAMQLMGGSVQRASGVLCAAGPAGIRPAARAAKRAFSTPAPRY